MDGTHQTPARIGFGRGIRAGLLATLPILLGVLPFGMVFGVIATESGLDLVQTMAMTAAVIAGASQLAALQLLADGAPAALAVLAGAVVNLRMAMYSAALVPWWQGTRAGVRALAALVLHDHSFALSMARYRERPDMGVVERLGFYFAVGLFTSSAWIGSTWIGARHGAEMLQGIDLGFVLPVTFLAITAPMIRGRRAAAGAVVASALAVAFSALPFGLGLLVATAGGILAGLAVPERAGREEPAAEAPDPEGAP